jgi:hypothetical protein
MPTMAVSLNGSPLFKYEETSPTSTAELFAVVEAAANQTATTVERLISSAMTSLLRRKLLHDGDGGLEKNCLTYLILSELVPSSRGADPIGTIAEWLPALDFRVNIIGQAHGFVLEISRGEIKRH